MGYKGGAGLGKSEEEVSLDLLSLTDTPGGSPGRIQKKSRKNIELRKRVELKVEMCRVSREEIVKPEE